MTKKAKILTALSLLSFFILIMLIMFSWLLGKNENNTVAQNKPAQKVDLKKIEENYKRGLTSILADYEKNVNQSVASATPEKKPISKTSQEKNALADETIPKIDNYRNQLLALTVPPSDDIMDLHVSIVLAFDKMQNYFENSDIKSLEESRNLIKIARDKNPWLDQQHQ